MNLALRAETDPTHAIVRTFLGPGSYCLNQDQMKVAKIWKEIQRRVRDGKEVALLTQDLRNTLVKYCTAFIRPTARWLD